MEHIEGNKRKSTDRVSIYDVAKHIGVSPGTVSRVINNRARVKTATREKVLAAARELGFRPQVAIRRQEIAIITEEDYSDRISGYSATMTQHLAFELTQRGMSMVLPEKATDSLKTTYMNGAVILSHGVHSERAAETLRERIPIVHLDWFENLENRYSVSSDHEQAGYFAASHFLDRGRKRPAFLGFEGPPNRARLRGFLRAFEEKGCSFDEELCQVIPQGEPFYAGLNALVRMQADAIYVPGSSFQAMEALHILSFVMKVRVPEDIALIGGENDRFSSLLVPPLTTVEEPLRDLAAKAVSILSDLLIEEREPDRKTNVLPVRLINRISGG